MKLNIKGSPRQLCWGMGALEGVCDELGISLQDLDNALVNNETSVLNKLTYSALKNGAEINDDSLDFNYKFFLNWLDEEPQGTADQITNDFMNSKLLGKTMLERFDELIARLSVNEDTTAIASKKKSTRLVKS